MKNYDVYYNVRLSEHYEIEANSEAEAEEKFRKMIYSGEIGNFNEMDLMEDWVDVMEINEGV